MAAEVGRPGGLSKPCILIIVVASVERFAYKGVASNLVTYLTDHVKLGTSAAAKSVNNWSGVTSMLPLLGAFLADSYWDRYSTILGSSLIYVAGLVALTSWVLLCAWMPSTTLFLPLYLISVGQGGYNPSLQAFGADQLRIGEELSGKNEEERSKRKSQFFQWWYFGICSGSLLGNSIMSYIQDTYGWELGVAIPTAVMAVSVACFTAGAKCYVRNQQILEDSRTSRPIEDVFRGIKRAVLNRVQKNGALKLPPKEADVRELELQARPFCEESGDLDVKINQQEITPLVPSVGATIRKLLPVWTLLLMFAVIFQLPSTFFTRQGTTMKRDIGSFIIPPATLQSSITISIIILMPLYDKLIVPVICAVTRRDNGISVLQRIGVGMLLSILAMVVAATVEARRLRSQNEKEQPTILWLLPQYVLLGVSDVFTVVGMQEFFYTQVPGTMRTIGIGLYLSVFGVGSFLSSALISVVEAVTSAAAGVGGRGWLPDNMADARLDKYYWLLALLSSISFVCYVYLCKRYKEDGDVSSSNQYRDWN